MDRVKGKVAIVTGGASGIGEATARLLAREGAKVAIVDIDDENGQRVAREIVKEGGIANFWHMDISKENEVKKTFTDIYGKYGRLHILVNNAGIPGYRKPPHETTSEEWDRVMDVDLKGSFFFAQAAAGQMIKEGHGGKIVNFSSVSAIIPTDPPAGPKVTYDAAKGGVISMTRSLAKDWGEFGIRVNCIQPGPFLNESVRQAAPDLYEKAIAHTVLKRSGTPYDIANVALFLCSSASDFVTGGLIPVDGGFLLY